MLRIVIVRHVEEKTWRQSTKEKESEMDREPRKGDILYAWGWNGPYKHEIVSVGPKRIKLNKVGSLNWNNHISRAEIGIHYFDSAKDAIENRRANLMEQVSKAQESLDKFNKVYPIN
jgi:hypothetical protein